MKFTLKKNSILIFLLRLREKKTVYDVIRDAGRKKEVNLTKILPFQRRLLQEIMLSVFAAKSNDTVPSLIILSAR